MPDRARQLSRASTDLLTELDMDRVVALVNETMCSLMQADASSVSLIDTAGTHIVLIGAQGLSPAYVRSVRVPVADARRLYRGPGQHLIIDMERSPIGDSAAIKAEGLTKVIAFPLVRRGEFAGAINAYLRGTDRTFPEENLDLAHVLAAEAGIAISNAMMYRELREQRDAEAQLVEDLRRVELEKEEFLSIVSHELRTPLTPLKALAQLLVSRIKRSRDKGQPLDLDSLERNLQSIERQVDRMNGLVSDLLSVSRAERGKLEIDNRPFDLALSVRDMVERYAQAAREDGRHEFEVDAPGVLTLTGDQARIEQMLMNLIGNAVKYSPRGGTVRVSLAKKGGAAEIAITDEGIGITAEDMPRLGSAFTRGTGKAATFAGMGIGLHVAKLLTEAHGGTLKLESAGEDRGTTVRVTLPT
ncbi:MAG TPA: GAF domain-containing sensor histidine kinase [Candidatus Acidoferrales bacterium]|nr:GAF domain-containing sensor histidine kinase [Candidatus Acidoferrales bacterium]